MSDASLELLDRQLEYLLGLPDEDFLFAADGFLEALVRDPQLGIHLQDLEHEADDLGQELHAEEHGEGQPARLLLRIWEDLGHELPNPQAAELVEQNGSFRGLYGHFEYPAVAALDATAGHEDSSRIGQLIAMVARFDVSAGHAVIDRYREGYDTLRANQELVHARLLRATRTHPGVALLRLRCLALTDPHQHSAEARSRPRVEGQPPMLVVRGDAHGRGWNGLVDAVLRNERTVSDYGAGPTLLVSLRAAAQRLGLELRGRLGTTRSRLAMIERYHARCEWHDRARLQQLAQEATGAREHALRDDLARYLFDAGLHPLSEAVLGTHARADLFEPDPRSGFVLRASPQARARRPRSPPAPRAR